MTTEETLEDLLGDDVIIHITNDGVITNACGRLEKSFYTDHYSVNDLHFLPSKVSGFRVFDHVIIDLSF